VLIFDPAMPSQAIQKQIDAVYSTQEHNEPRFWLMADTVM